MSADFAGMDALSLNYWFSKFVTEVTKTSGERYPPQECLWNHLCPQALFGGEKWVRSFESSGRYSCGKFAVISIKTD